MDIAQKKEPGCAWKARFGTWKAPLRFRVNNIVRMMRSQLKMLDILASGRVQAL